MNSEIKILVVDDHQIIRDGIKSLLSDVGDINIVAESDSGKEAILVLEKISSEIDVVLMDISMPEMDGFTATKIITGLFPNIKVIALSIHNDESHISQMIESGVSGYLLKTVGVSELEDAIRKVVTGETYFTSEVANTMMSQFVKKKSTKLPIKGQRLSARELEVLKLISDGFTNPEIAEKLYLSTRTIDSHRRNLLQKLDKKNTAGLVRYAIEHGIG